LILFTVLIQAGLDSLASLELRARLSHTFGQDMPATLAFDYPTVEAMANFIKQHGVANDQNSTSIQTTFSPLVDVRDSLRTIIMQVMGVAVSDEEPLMEARSLPLPLVPSGYFRYIIHFCVFKCL
jgi:Phosphopantetheine attachment site